MKPESSPSKKCQTRSRGRVGDVTGSSQGGRGWGRSLQLPAPADTSLTCMPDPAEIAAENLPGPAIRNSSTLSTLFGVGSILYPVVRSTGLGSFLTVRAAGKMNRRYYARVLSRLDPSTMGMSFPDGQVRFVDREAVARITGVVSGPKPVRFGPLPDRVCTIETVQGLLGLDVRAAAGVKVGDLQKVAQICHPEEMTRPELDTACVAYTLLVCCTQVDPKTSQSNVPDELLACVEDPAKIGEYDRAGYILNVTRRAAEKFKADLLAGAKTYTLGGCSLLLQVFSIDWMDFKAASVHTDMLPKIAVYTSEMMETLIKLIEEDRVRSAEHRRYKTRPQGSFDGLQVRWHPMLEPSTELTAAGSPVGIEEGMDKIMLVIDETVMPMMMNALVTVAAEATEANRGVIVEEFFTKANEHKKWLQFAFGSKLYPDAVKMSDNSKAGCVGSSS